MSSQNILEAIMEPHFSTDLDFNLLEPEKADMAYDKVCAILTRFGTIDDEAKKLYGPVLVLNLCRRVCRTCEEGKSKTVDAGIRRGAE